MASNSKTPRTDAARQATIEFNFGRRGLASREYEGDTLDYVPVEFSNMLEMELDSVKEELAQLKAATMRVTTQATIEHMSKTP